MEWIRGEAVGRGSFGAVNLVVPRIDSSQVTQLMAVKSALASESVSLRKEKEVLCLLRDCPQIVKCLGDGFSIENGKRFYNIFLEYASGGSLADLLKNSGGRLGESDVRYYTRSILKGLRYIHENGYVHCDIKLQNILLCCSIANRNEVKIADFGLAKKARAREKNENKENTENGVFALRGTPLYMSPESVARNEYEAASDIWSLGCTVAEMFAGKPAWTCREAADVGTLLLRIGYGVELPEIPGGLSEQGRDFLSKCLVRNPKQRWTAEMLLNHPFVAEATCSSLPETEKPSSSPRSAFDFPEWNSPRANSTSMPSLPSSRLSSSSSVSSSSFDRMRQLVTRRHQPEWSLTDGWVIVRQAE